jgi:hypothetical protein
MWPLILRQRKNEGGATVLDRSLRPGKNARETAQIHKAADPGNSGRN